MNVLKPHLQTTIRALLHAGGSQREIERVSGISRNPICDWETRFAAERKNCSGVAPTRLINLLHPGHRPRHPGHLLSLNACPYFATFRPHRAPGVQKPIRATTILTQGGRDFLLVEALQAPDASRHQIRWGFGLRKFRS